VLAVLAALAHRKTDHPFAHRRYAKSLTTVASGARRVVDGRHRKS
jgi:hypothetical protein